jgi:hypothetical protein
LFKGFVEYVVFYPPSNEENLRCKPTKPPQNRGQAKLKNRSKVSHYRQSARAR